MQYTMHVVVVELGGSIAIFIILSYAKQKNQTTYAIFKVHLNHALYRIRKVKKKKCKKKTRAMLTANFSTCHILLLLLVVLCLAPHHQVSKVSKYNFKLCTFIYNGR